MKNPLVEAVELVLGQLGISHAKLIHESYDQQNFGNAEAVFEIGHLRLRFIRDRGQDFVDLGSSTSPGHYYLFDDVSVMMRWESLNDIVGVDEPISLNKALGYIQNDLDKLDKAFSAEEIISTNAKLKSAERQRTKAMFSSSKLP
jgi:hypothetical protein